MAVYTDNDHVTAIIGQYGVNLRTDDGSLDDLMGFAFAYATTQVDFYCARYDADDLADNAWVQNIAAFFAVKYLCLRRLNAVASSIAKELKDVVIPQLELIQMGEAPVPRIDQPRRPVAVDNYHVDQRQFNNQVRVDPSRSTGVTELPRSVDWTAPDQR